MVIRNDKVGYVRILLPNPVIEAAKELAKEDRRSLSNYLACIVLDEMEDEIRKKREKLNFADKG